MQRPRGIAAVWLLVALNSAAYAAPPQDAAGAARSVPAPVAGLSESADDFARVATIAIVPDGYATIQAALDSPADTVLVRYGTYAESLRVSRPVVLRGLPDATTADTLPRISSASVDLWTGWPCYGQGAPDGPLSSSFENLAFDGRVTVDGYHGSCNGPDSAGFENCRFDGEVNHHNRGVKLALRRCVFRGAVAASSYVFCEGSTFIGGSISAQANDGGFADIHDNVFLDARGAAIHLYGELGAEVCGNRIIGGELGILANPLFLHPPYRIHDNLVSGCTSDGIRVANSVVLHNTVLNCGGAGIVITSAEDSCVGNRVQDVRGDGISIDRFSTSRRSSRRDVIDNVVVRAGGSGIVSSDGNIVGNVVGHCGGDGIRGGDNGAVLRNTCYASGGNGISLLHANAANNNISAWNRGWGLQKVGSWPSEFPKACNDWFMNDSGPVRGFEIGATDLSVDPLFCDMDSDSVWLRFDSPLVGVAGCGLVGALGVGCDAVTSTRDPEKPAPPTMTYELALSPPVPNPARGHSRIRYSLPEAMTVRLSVFDVLGRQVAALVRGRQEAGEHDVPLSVAGLRAGVYLARLEADGRRLTQRVLIVP